MTALWHSLEDAANIQKKVRKNKALTTSEEAAIERSKADLQIALDAAEWAAIPEVRLADKVRHTQHEAGLKRTEALRSIMRDKPVLQGASITRIAPPTAPTKYKYTTEKVAEKLALLKSRSVKS